ncbi:hypothetical protein FHT72_006732 [Rhizobium sp. BK077]|uniref:hypothetical protein n=1 Tax=unclassified Rhizobium TaxID=2613769 RepID=UPI00160A55B2|nr:MULTISPECIES: hypothetical protein [unclassified Rhizobium]MBB3303156.1 hypothetical protein [Rhizobium sp. BK112]MBB3372198.1 hypothetical protein [Rhizobium sp. BK077]MBB4183033.1 hypothetical protein [Rhizobium sp. BK109]
MNDSKPSAITIVTDPKYHRYRRWRLSRERTTVEGIASSIALLRTGKFETIEQLADAMKLTVPQVRWRLRNGLERGFIDESFYKSFAAPP